MAIRAVLAERVPIWRHRVRGRRRRAIAYRRILVPVLDNADAPRAIDVACTLSATGRVHITALTVIEVPESLPLDAHMAEDEDDGRRLLGRMEAVGNVYGIKISTAIPRAREAATAIVDQANAMGAELIVIGGQRGQLHRGRAPVFGRTVREVLTKAPCRVMLLATAPERPNAELQRIIRARDRLQAGA